MLHDFRENEWRMAQFKALSIMKVGKQRLKLTIFGEHTAAAYETRLVQEAPNRFRFESRAKGYHGNQATAFQHSQEFSGDFHDPTWISVVGNTIKVSMYIS